MDEMRTDPARPTTTETDEREARDQTLTMDDATETTPEFGE